MQNHLVNCLDGGGCKRRRGLAACAVQNLLFTARRAGRSMELLLDQPHFANYPRPFVEQLYDLVVNGVDSLPRRVESLSKVRAGLGEKA